MATSTQRGGSQNRLLVAGVRLCSEDGLCEQIPQKMSGGLSLTERGHGGRVPGATVPAAPPCFLLVILQTAKEGMRTVAGCAGQLVLELELRQGLSIDIGFGSWIQERERQGRH